MWRSALFIARKDVQYMLREKETLVWTFVMPIIFFYFVGTATAGFGGGPRGKDRLAVEVPADAGYLADHLLRRLADRGYEIVQPATPEERDRHTRLLSLPAKLTESVLAGTPATLRLRRRGEGPGVDLDRLRVSRAAYTFLADLILVRRAGGDAGPQAFEAIASKPRPLTLQVRPAGRRVDPPTGFEQAIPGTLVMFTMMLLLTSGAILLMVERRQGLLRRLASAPVSRGAIVAGKWGGRMALALVQIVFGVAAGTLLFRMDWGSSLPMVALVLFGWAAFCSSLGLLLGSIAATEGQAIGLAVLGTMAMAALGGCWWPIEVTPAWMQHLALVLPTGWTMDALHRLVSFRADALSALPHALGLLAGALALGALAARRFRFD
jgi:hypothetical protein